MAGPNTQTPVYRGYTARIAALRTAPLLSNPHSRSVRRSPRFSPTRSFDKSQDRFIPLAAPAEMIPQLDYSNALGDKSAIRWADMRNHD